MTYDPIAKKAYDKERNAKIKAEYLANNPNYKPTRTAQKEQSEERKRKYLDTQPGGTKSPPYLPTASGFAPPHQQPLFFQTLGNQITQPGGTKSPPYLPTASGFAPPAPKPKEKYNNNSIMRKKNDDEYDDGKTPIVQPKPIFYY